MIGKALRVMIVEDSEDDALLMVHALQKSGYAPQFRQVQSLDEMRTALAEQSWDVILSDFNLPGFTGLHALNALKETGHDFPFILVSGAIGEEMAVTILKAGAHDFINKNNLQRLPPAVDRELRDAAIREDFRQAQKEILRRRKEWEEIFQSIGSPAIILDANHRIIAANKEALRATGLTGDEIIGRTCHAIFHGAQTKTPAEGCPIARLIETGETEVRSMEMEAFGGVYLITSTPIRNKSGQIEKIIHIATDINDRVQAEEALRKQDLLFKKLSIHVPGMIYQFMRKPDGTFCLPFSSEAIKTCFGCSPEEARDSFEPIRRVIWPDDMERVLASIEASAAGMTTWECEYRVQIPGRPVRWMRGHATPERLNDGSILWHGYNRDYTVQKDAEETLRKSEELYRRITENMADVVWTTDLEFHTTYVSPSVERLMGEPAKDHVKRGMEEKFPPEALAEIRRVLTEELAKEEDPRQDKNRSRMLRVQHYRADGTPIWVAVNVTFVRDEDGKPVGFQGVTRDVSDFVQAEEEIRRHRARLEGLLRISQYRTESIQELVNYALDEAIELTESRIGYIDLYDDRKGEFQLNTYSRGTLAECNIPNPKMVYRLDHTGIWGEAVRQGKAIVVNDFQAPHPLKKGYPEGHVPLYKFLTVPVFQGDRIVAVAGVANKPTDYDDSDVRQLTLLMDAAWRMVRQKQGELDLQRAERQYRALFENALEGIYQNTLEGRYLTANKAMAHILGYDNPQELLDTVTDIGTQVFAEAESYQSLLRKAITEGQVHGHECTFKRKDGRIIWVSLSQREVRDSEGRLLHYEGQCEDITERRQSVERLHNALGATIQAMAMAVEVRDPYTAGHQRRVAELSHAVASELGLPRQRIEGLRLAATIHDLGKIAIPGEILSKPSRLTEIEFNLIKIHPESGFDILKDIDFPWPISRMVLEHHERINGTGYPRGLVGDELLLESKILAVSDVVESMASYRPYRPALGLEQALLEIEKNRGVLYEPDVVDACLQMFREKGYRLQ